MIDEEIEVLDISDENINALNKKNLFVKVGKIVVIVLSILIGISSIGLSIYCFYNSVPQNIIDLVGVFKIIFLTLGGFMFIILGCIGIGLLWTIYWIVLLFLKLSHKKKKVIIVSVVILVLLFSFASISEHFYLKDKLAIKLNQVPIGYKNFKSTYYFIHDDKIYYYKNDKDTNYKDKLYVMNIDGIGNKLITSNNNLRDAVFNFVYKNEAYYYSNYLDKNMTINLSTGDINDLKNNYAYFSQTLEDGKIYLLEEKEIKNNVKINILKRVDLDTGQVIEEKQTIPSILNEDIFYDFERGDMYYITTDILEYTTIPNLKLYKNEDVIYEFNEDVSKVDIIDINNDFIYYLINNNVYELNINTKEVEKNRVCNLNNNCKLNKYDRLYSENSTDSYFYIDNSIYRFNYNLINFELIINNVESALNYVYSNDKYLIIAEGTDFLSNSINDLFGSVIVYDKLSGFEKRYPNVRRLLFDGDYMYLFINDEKIEKHNIK